MDSLNFSNPHLGSRGRGDGRGEGGLSGKEEEGVVREGT